MDAQFISKLQETHLALWNEKDPARREQLAQTIYADDITMYDKDFILSGRTEVLGFITKLLTGDPAFRFTPAKPMQATQNGIRLFWNIHTGGADLTGMDFFVIKEERVRDLFVFMDNQ